MDDIFFLFHDRNETISLYKLHPEKYENNDVIGYLTPIINFHSTKLTNFDPRFFFPVLFSKFLLLFLFFFLTFESLTFADREIEREVEQFRKFHSPAGEDDLNTYEKILITFYDETVLRTPF